MRRPAVRRRLGIAVVVIMAGLALLGGCGEADERSEGPRRDWALPNADRANTRNVPSSLRWTRRYDEATFGPNGLTIVKLDERTGELLWGRQVLPIDDTTAYVPVNNLRSIVEVDRRRRPRVGARPAHPARRLPPRG